MGRPKGSCHVNVNVGVEVPMIEESEMKLNQNYSKSFIISSGAVYQKQSYYLYITLSSVLLFLVLIFWLSIPNPVYKILKSVVAGLLLIYYSWEIIYFDSIMPGIHPSSPLSPSSIKTITGHTLHLNYALAVIIGIFFSIFIYSYT